MEINWDDYLYGCGTGIIMITVVVMPEGSRLLSGIVGGIFMFVGIGLSYYKSKAKVKQ